MYVKLPLITQSEIKEIEDLLKDSPEENSVQISSILNEHSLPSDLQIKIFNIDHNFAWNFRNFTDEFCKIIFNMDFYKTKANYLVNSIISRMIDLRIPEAKPYLCEFFKKYPHSGILLRSYSFYRKLSEENNIKEILKSFLESEMNVNETYLIPEGAYKKIEINPKTFYQIKLKIIKGIINEIKNAGLLELAILNFPHLIKNNFSHKFNESIGFLFSNKRYKIDFIKNNIDFLKKSKAIREHFIRTFCTAEEYEKIFEEINSKKEKLWFKY